MTPTHPAGCERGAMPSQESELGPVDVVVIGYPPGAPRTGEAIPLFIDLVDRGIIRVLDVLMVEKNEDGVIAGLELADLGGEITGDLQLLAGRRSGLLADEDANAAAQALEPGSLAVLICFENAWAAPFATAVRRNGGQVLAFERVAAPELLDAINALDSDSA
jgi:uncharacterized protein DUF6325